MKGRRFLSLAVALVAVNAFFWIAQGGFALPQALINQFFGNRMVRAEVIVQSPTGTQDWRIDRGVITSIVGNTFTLREGDGTSVTLQIDPNARVEGPARFATVALFRRRLRILAFHEANAPAELVQVEGAGR